MAENVANIADFGAEPNPDDPDLAVAEKNLLAVQDAAAAAGEGGTVFIPEGTFFIGSDSIVWWTNFGIREPAGINFAGEDPTKSILGVTGTVDDDSQIHTLLRYADDANHGTVSISDLKLEGNWENLPDLKSAGRGSILVDANGAISVDIENVWVRGAYTTGLDLVNVAAGTISRCTIEESALGVENDSGGSSVSHAIKTAPAAGEELLVEYCEITRSSGEACNIEAGTGNTTLDNCWMRSLGTGVLKVGGDNETVTVRHCYAEPTTDWIRNATVGDWDGRAFARRISETSTPNLHVDNLEFHNCERHFIEVRDVENPTSLQLTGDMIAVHKAATNADRDSVIRDDSGGSLTKVDVNRISVHDTGEAVFSLPNADGQIETLRRRGNDGLGDAGDLTIATDMQGDPFVPDVVSRDEVGINSTTDSTPSISWASPSGSDTLSGTTTLQIDASDAEDGDDTLSVDYSIDGSSWQTATYNADTGYYEDSWDTSAVADGSHTLNARVTDSGGNSSSTAVEVTVGKLFDAWTPRWNSEDEDWAVRTESGLKGDAALAFEPAETDRTRYALSWDDIGEPSDVEVLDKFRVPAFTDDETLGYYARVHLRSSVQNGNENGYWIELEEPENAFRLAKYTGGNLTTLKRFGTPAENAFFYRRFRAEGNQLKAKIWPATESEPSSWDVELTDDDHTSGWVGVGSYDAALVETDTFSAATGGQQAPFLDRDTAPSVGWGSPADGETVGDTVTIQIEASDTEDANDSLTVDYRVDGNSWRSAAYNVDSGYYEDSWDTTGSADGSHTLEARVTDTAGHTAKGSISVTVDNAEETTSGSAPIVNRFSVSEAKRPDPHAEITAVWDVSDSDGDLDLVEIEVSDSSGTVQGVSWTVSGSKASDTDTFRVQDGDGAAYDVTITVTDDAGQSNSVTKSVTA